jgi:hypothetical protein
MYGLFIPSILQREFVVLKAFAPCETKLYNAYPLSNTVKTIKSRRMRWVGHIARVEDVETAQTFWPQKLKKNNFGEIGKNGEIILKTSLREGEVMKELRGLNWLRIIFTGGIL